MAELLIRLVKRQVGCGGALADRSPATPDLRHRGRASSQTGLLALLTILPLPPPPTACTLPRQEDNPEEDAALEGAASAVDRQLDEGYRALGQGQ